MEEMPLPASELSGDLMSDAEWLAAMDPRDAADFLARKLAPQEIPEVVGAELSMEEEQDAEEEVREEPRELYNPYASRLEESSTVSPPSGGHQEVQYSLRHPPDDQPHVGAASLPVGGPDRYSGDGVADQTAAVEGEAAKDEDDAEAQAEESQGGSLEGGAGETEADGEQQEAELEDNDATIPPEMDANGVANLLLAMPEDKATAILQSMSPKHHGKVCITVFTLCGYYPSGPWANLG